MSNEIQFDVDTVQRSQFKSSESMLVRGVIRYSHGLIKNETRANYVLLGVSVLMIVLSMLLFSKANERPPQPSPQEMFRMMTLPPVAPV